MIKNIPVRYTQKQLEAEFEQTHKGTYSCLDFPQAKDNPLNNLGYCFIDFIHPLFLVDFYHTYKGHEWSLYNSKKKLEIRYGTKKAKIKGHKRHNRSYSSMDGMKTYEECLLND